MLVDWRWAWRKPVSSIWLLIEIDEQACQTIRQNQGNGNRLVKSWPLQQTDVREFDYSTIESDVDLLSAGVPCQPFSVAGRGLAYKDRRDMFGEIIRAAREIRPKAILIENVQGLLRTAFQDYFDYLLSAIAAPTLARCSDQGWHEHLEYLRKRTPTTDLRYDVYVHPVNAADYGIPQWRNRILIVAFRSDLGVNWSPPQPTHGIDALVSAQWESGAYWKRHGLHRRHPGLMSRRIATRVKALKDVDSSVEAHLSPWRTVRDAISDLPTPRRGRDADRLSNHALRPGARLYTGHSGSLLDEPAKTLKAGSHGVPGGENTLALSGGRLRYFSVRECARLQTFPDDYVFSGSWSSTMRQVGNAVPVSLARTFTKKISEHLMR